MGVGAHIEGQITGRELRPQFPMRLPPRSHNLNPNIERFMRSVKEECLQRMVFFGERPLHSAVVAFPAHCNAERNHQALDNRLIDRGDEVGCTTRRVACRERLGGMLRAFFLQKGVRTFSMCIGRSLFPGAFISPKMIEPQRPLRPSRSRRTLRRLRGLCGSKCADRTR